MKHYLYVCNFSNGHIKVGRSIAPIARIAQHAERVACFGVELVNHIYYECISCIDLAEKALIKKCAEESTKNNKREWFDGLNYASVCEWAYEYANTQYPAKKEAGMKGKLLCEQKRVRRNTFKLSHKKIRIGMKKQYAIALLGGTPTEASKALGRTPQAVSAWPDILSELQEARVLFKYSKLPQNKRREYMAAAKATEVQA